MAKKNRNDDTEGDDLFDLEGESADESVAESLANETFILADDSDDFELDVVDSNIESSQDNSDSKDPTREEKRGALEKTVIVDSESSSGDATSDEGGEFDDQPPTEKTILYGDGELTKEDSFGEDIDELDIFDPESDSDWQIPDFLGGTPEIKHVVKTKGDIGVTVQGDEKDESSFVDFELSVDEAPEHEQSEEYDDSLYESFNESGAGGVKGWGKQSPDATPMSSLESPTKSKRMMASPKLNDRLVVADVQAKEIGNPDYRIVSFLGEGAMGKVFIARQTSVDRDVALKVQIQKKSKSRRKQIRDQSKFLFEAQITANLDHPNIVGVYDLGRDQNGEVFYCMELVRGDPWNDVIDEMSLEENLSVLEKVIDGIAYAHSKETIHRDLKPENIMLGSFGEVLIMDWGLGVNLSHGPPTSMGGTPGFMAPEMARLPETDTGTHSDIYLLGAILFMITTGVPPHTGEDVQECLQNAKDNIHC